MTYADLVEKEPRLIHEPAEFENGFLRCNNCCEPASASMTIAVGWIGCAACITGSATALIESVEQGDLVTKE